MAKEYFTVSDFYCVRCGNKGIPVARKMSRQREEGHLKNMYCMHCKENLNHIEIRPFDYDYTVEDLKEDIINGEYKMREHKE